MFKTQLRRYGQERDWRDLSKSTGYMKGPDRETLAVSVLERSRANRSWEYRIVDLDTDQVTDTFFRGVRTKLEPDAPAVFVPMRTRRKVN